VVGIVCDDAYHCFASASQLASVPPEFAAAVLVLVLVPGELPEPDVEDVLADEHAARTRITTATAASAQPRRALLPAFLLWLVLICLCFVADICPPH
jgi:hypothetical protein